MCFGRVEAICLSIGHSNFSAPYHLAYPSHLLFYFPCFLHSWEVIRRDHLFAGSVRRSPRADHRTLRFGRRSPRATAATTRTTGNLLFVPCGRQAGRMAGRRTELWWRAGLGVCGLFLVGRGVWEVEYSTHGVSEIEAMIIFLLFGILGLIIVVKRTMVRGDLYM